MGKHGPARWQGSEGGKRSVQARTAPAGAPTPPEAPAPQPVVETHEIDATDAAKAFAEEQNIDLATVTGTGTEGRVTKDDVVAAVEARAVDAQTKFAE